FKYGSQTQKFDLVLGFGFGTIPTFCRRRSVEAEMDELFDSFGRIMPVFKCLPVAKEESDEQEKEEDASSTSCVDYYYSEEDDGEVDNREC
ncbi:hypothetical protein C5167_035809, partial [Papaver somniferum]